MSTCHHTPGVCTATCVELLIPCTDVHYSQKRDITRMGRETKSYRRQQESGQTGLQGCPCFSNSRKNIGSR